MWRWVKSGNIKTSVTLGGQYRISEGNLEAFIVENQVYPLLSNSSSKEKILVVDDDIQIQEVGGGPQNLDNMLSSESDYKRRT